MACPLLSSVSTSEALRSKRTNRRFAASTITDHDHVLQIRNQAKALVVSGLTYIETI